MTTDSERKEAGRLGEEIAAQFLSRKGYKVIAKNYRKPWGEIDIIAVKSGTVRFVEVKAVSRESRDYRPEELIDQRKLQKIARTAELYMDSKDDKREYQIDAVGVIMDLKTRRAQCRLFEQVLG